MRIATRASIAGLLALGLAAAAAASERLEGRQAVLSPDGSVTAVFASSRELRFVRADGTVASTLALPTPGIELAFSPDGRRAALSLFGGGVLVADVSGGTPDTYDAAGVCSDLSWSPDGRRLQYVARNQPPTPMIEGSVDLKSVDMPSRAVRALHRIKEERQVPLTGPAARAASASPPAPQAPPRRKQNRSGVQP